MPWERFEKVLEKRDASRVIVHTVSYRQDIVPVEKFAKSLGAKHLIQPIQAKPDYGKKLSTRNYLTSNELISSKSSGVSVPLAWRSLRPPISTL